MQTEHEHKPSLLDGWNSPPNIVTYTRIVLVLVFLGLDIAAGPQGSHSVGMRWAAAILFIIAASTDKLDGWMARKYNQVTELGKLMDPIADNLVGDHPVPHPRNRYHRHAVLRHRHRRQGHRRRQGRQVQDPVPVHRLGYAAGAGAHLHRQHHGVERLHVHHELPDLRGAVPMPVFRGDVRLPCRQGASRIADGMNTDTIPAGDNMVDGMADPARRDALAGEILAYCERRQVKIAAAESLTGGLLADAFVRVPGASKVFLGSAVTYDIHAKAKILGVDPRLLDTQGAVHPEVARQMAWGTARLYDQPAYCGRVIGLSTTGVAGPGPDGDKPAGLVYIGCSLPGAVTGGERVTRARELRLHGTREQVREQTVWCVLENVRQLTVSFEE